MAQPNMQEVYDALRRADAAGDTEAVQRLAAYIQSSEQQPQDDSAVRGFVGGMLEPVGNLARGLQALPVVGPALKAEMLALVAEVADETGATVLMVTHDPADARRFAPLTVLVADGKACPPTDTATLFANPPRALADYLG